MGKKELTFVSKVLISVIDAAGTLHPFFSLREFKKRSVFGRSYKTYYNTIYQLYKRGWVRFADKDGERFIKLTKKGALEALTAKLHEGVRVGKWDGKWRVVMFDVPESAHAYRDRLRWLLKQQGFRYIQGSVWINPFPLARAAVEYLNASGLNKYVRIMRVDEMDNDTDLRKKFGV